MNGLLVAYLVIAAIVAVITYCIGVAQSADEELIIAVLLCCTLVPIVSIIIGIAWPLALVATGIRLAVRD